MGQGQQTFKTLFGSQLLTIETNKLALNATASVLLRYGATTLLSTFVKKKRQSGLTPAFALQLQTSAASKDWTFANAKLQQLPWTQLLKQISGQAIAINNLVLTGEQPEAAGLAAVFGSSLAAYLGDALEQPLASVTVAQVSDKFILNPTLHQSQQATLKLALVGQQAGLLQLNGWADNLAADTILMAVAFGQAAITRFCEHQITIKTALRQQSGKANIINIPTAVPQAVVQHLSMTTEFDSSFSGTGLVQQGQDQVLSRIQVGAVAKTDQLQMTYHLPAFAFGQGLQGTPGLIQAQLDQHFLTQVLQGLFPKASAQAGRLDTQVLTASGGHLAAAVTANTLALLAAGMPIKQPVVGATVNIFEQHGALKLGPLPQNADSLGALTIAGTAQGITAITGLGARILWTQPLIQSALALAKSARQTGLTTLVQTLGGILPPFD